MLSKLRSTQAQSQEASQQSQLRKKPLSERAIGAQLCSAEFAFILLFSCIFFTRASLYLGLLGEFLASSRFSQYSSDTQSFYLNMLSAVVPLGALFAPVIDPMIKRLGFLWYAQWIAVVALVYSLFMFWGRLEAQLVGCIFFTYFRANVFAYPGIYNLTVFGGRTVGTIQGLMFTLSAPFNYLSSPALAWTAQVNSFDPLNYVLIAAIAPVVLLVFVMMCTTKEDGMHPAPPSSKSSAAAQR